MRRVARIIVLGLKWRNLVSGRASSSFFCVLLHCSNYACINCCLNAKAVSLDWKLDHSVRTTQTMASLLDIVAAHRHDFCS